MNQQTSTERPQAVAVSAGIKTWYLTVNTDIKQTEGGYEYLSRTVTLDHYPTMADIRQAVCDAIDERTEAKIIDGFVWNGKPVWLSKENQFNFKAAYDLAVQTGGESLPVKYKLGQDAERKPVYHTFNSMNAFTDFYTKAIAYIQQCLNEGWAEKDSVDWTPYEEAINPVSE
jgi:hypothetical protein